MIREFKNVEHALTGQQQVQAITQCFPDSWEYMRVNMTHNDSIKTFNDFKPHLELENDCVEATKYSNQFYMANSKPQIASGFKCKRGNNTF